jgi:hypothetical protein
MAQRFYLTRKTAPYTPATVRGTWNDVASLVTRALDCQKTGGGVSVSVTRTNGPGSQPWATLLYRGVFRPLSAQTIAGTLDVGIGMSQNSVNADFAIKLHLYATTGDIDTPRGTLLDNYAETTANEFTSASFNIGRTLTAPQTLSSLAIQNGDRLVVEVGYVRYSITTSYTGTLYYGTQDASGVTMPSDLTLNGNRSLLAPFIAFSQDLIEQPPLVATATIPRDLEEARIKGGALSPFARDPEEQRVKGVLVGVPIRDAEERRVVGG